MIRVYLFKCPENCTRQSAASLDKIGRCCTHGLPWTKQDNFAMDVRQEGDPAGTPLFREVEENKK